MERLCELNINVLFIIGGDGTLRGADRIASESQRRTHAIAIVGIPKTIDNDILFTDKSFGYETACAAAVQATRVAHTEACTVRNSIGMVKLMGRHSGFIACCAALMKQTSSSFPKYRLASKARMDCWKRCIDAFFKRVML